MPNESRRDLHETAVEALRDQYRALPADAPIRLAKPTSNLFRFRRPPTGSTLDVSRFCQVIDVDPATATADVGGMTSYEDLVEATLAHGLMPLVVPQLKTITLGGAVAGLGIESSSYRNGLPHESVLEMDVLTGAGEVLRAAPDGPNAELFRAFPNSYGTLGYALRCRIQLEPVRPYVRLRHVRCTGLDGCAAALAEVCDGGEYLGEPVDFVDGTVFTPNETYLSLGTFTDTAPDGASDYTGRQIYYRSIPRCRVDHLKVADYLWRWDTDWFWCSRAFGAQHPLVRRLWPKKYLRSDVYRKLVALDRRYRFSDTVDRLRRRRPAEPVIQDVEVPVRRLAEFCAFFDAEIGIRPVWLCPLRQRSNESWPLYPLEPERLYVNVGFWSAVPAAAGDRERSRHNRMIEDKVTELGGHKSLYSTSYYSEQEFWRLYNGEVYHKIKTEYDPEGRLPGLFDKCVLGH
ncbi:MAG: FAD-binding oxidoreductase [Sciscionella sp.]